MVPNVPLGDLLLDSQYGLSISSIENGQYPMFKMNNFDNGVMSSIGVDLVDLDLDNFNKYKLQYGDILFNRTNSIDLVGKTGVFTLTGDYVFASYLIRLKVNKEIADPFFVNFFMNDDSTKKRLKSIATKAVSQANINPTQLKKMLKVPLLPLPEQRKIAKILSTWDKAITTTEKLIATSQQQKKALMQKLLTGKKRLINPETGMVFEGDWEEVKLNTITKVSIGLVTTMTKHYVPDGVPLIRNSDIKPNKVRKEKLIFLSESFASENKHRKFQLNDVVTVHTGEVGVSAVIADDMVGSIGFATLNTRPNLTYVFPQFLSWYFNSDYFINWCVSMSTGDGRQNLNLKDFVKAVIPLPNIKEQQKIASVLTAADKEVALLQAKLAHLKQEKKALMQQLLTGKRRVNVEGIEAA